VSSINRPLICLTGRNSPHGSDFSQLKQARDQVKASGPAPVRLAIMDVGFDFSHRTRPEHLREDLQRNFVDDGQSPNDASDPYDRSLFKNPGHGTATIGILAGGLLSGMGVPEANTNDYLGGAPLAEVIPVRLPSVILMRTSAFASAGLSLPLTATRPCAPTSFP
jgi:hypothetical protein